MILVTKMELLHDNVFLVSTVSHASLPSPLSIASMQPSHPTKYASFSSESLTLDTIGLCSRLLLLPSAKTNTSRNQNIQCCESYDLQQKQPLPVPSSFADSKSCFARRARTAACLPGVPAAHLARPASLPRKVRCLGPCRAKSAAACIPAARRARRDSSQRAACLPASRGLPFSRTPRTARRARPALPRSRSPLHAARGLPSRRARLASPLHQARVLSPSSEACLPAVRGARPASPPSAAQSLPRLHAA
jgi:hypothetical protein